jgi:hypothetical protein
MGKIWDIGIASAREGDPGSADPARQIGSFRSLPAIGTPAGIVKNKRDFDAMVGEHPGFRRSSQSNRYM